MGFLCAVVLSASGSLQAQQSAATSRPAAITPQQGVYLVFPFENAGASPRLDWLGEGLEELTIQYLSDSGAQVYSHAGRAGELERYGLPVSAKLSRATMLRIAQDLDADYVIFGSFGSDGTSLTIEARTLRVDPPALLTPVHESGDTQFSDGLACKRRLASAFRQRQSLSVIAEGICQASAPASPGRLRAFRARPARHRR